MQPPGQERFHGRSALCCQLGGGRQRVFEEVFDGNQIRVHPIHSCHERSLGGRHRLRNEPCTLHQGLRTSTKSINLASLLNKCQVASVFGIGNGSNEHCRILVVRCPHRRSVGEEGWRILPFRGLGKIVALLISM
jgi:hypothetical protein